MNTQPVVRVHLNALDTITKTCAVTREDGLETGGILLGHQHTNGDLSVTVAGTPGPNALRRPRSFRRDPEHAQRLADTAYETDRSVWIGDWHTHPEGPEHPSPLDLNSYVSVLADPDLGMTQFLTIIVNPEPSGPALYPWSITSERLAPLGLWIIRRSLHAVAGRAG